MQWTLGNVCFTPNNVLTHHGPLPYKLKLKEIKGISAELNKKLKKLMPILRYVSNVCKLVLVTKKEQD